MSTLSIPPILTTPRDDAIALYRAFKGILSLSHYFLKYASQFCSNLRNPRKMDRCNRFIRLKLICFRFREPCIYCEDREVEIGLSPFSFEDDFAFLVLPILMSIRALLFSSINISKMFHVRICMCTNRMLQISELVVRDIDPFNVRIEYFLLKLCLYSLIM